MNAIQIIIAFLLILTIATCVDMYRYFRRAHRLREAQDSLARSLGKVVTAMGPFPQTPDTDVIE